MFSVIIPAHDSAATLVAALDSVRAQSFSDYEVIVVDDGSTDGSAGLARAHPVGCQVLEKARRAGPGAARNAAAKVARGEYLAFLDADDEWFPWTLETFAEVIRRSGRPALVGGTARRGPIPDDATGGSHRGASVPARRDGSSNSTTSIELPLGGPSGPLLSGRIEKRHAGEDTRATSSASSSPTEEPIFENQTDYFSTATQSLWLGVGGVAVLREEFLRVGGFAEWDANAEDSDLWLRLGKSPGFAWVESPPVFFYRETPGSLTRRAERIAPGYLNLVRAEKEGNYPGGQETCRLRRELLTRHTRAGSLTLLALGRPREAIALYVATFLWNASLGRIKYLVGFWLKVLGQAARRP